MGIASVRSRLYKYVEPAMAVRVLAENTSPTSVEDVDIRYALGRVLAEDIVSPVDRPMYNISHFDGFAVRSVDTAGASSKKPVRLRIAAGVDPRGAGDYTLSRGEAVFVETGHPIPAGADAVAPVESVRVQGDHVLIYRPMKPGENVIHRGSDIARGEVVAGKGSIVSPGLQKLLMDLGVGVVKVYRRPRASVIATGNEVVDYVPDPGSGRIPPSTSCLIAAALRHWGAEIHWVYRVGDDPSEIVEAVASALRHSDIVATIGGVSLGPRDYTWTSLVRELKPKAVFRGVRMHPGRSTSGMAVDGKPIVNLPGLPMSTLASLSLILLPLLARISGQASFKLPYLEAMALSDYTIAAYPGFHRIRLVKIGDRGGAEIIAGVESYHVSPLARASGFTIVPPNKLQVRRGEAIRVYFLEPIFTPPLAAVMPPRAR